MTIREELEQILPRASVDTLLQTFGGRIIRLPVPQPRSKRQARDERIVRAYDRYGTHREAAAAVGVSVRTSIRATKRYT